MEPAMMARDLFGIAVITVIYCAVFLALFWIAMAAGEGHGPLATLSAGTVAILSFPLISPFLYFDSFFRVIAQEPVRALIRLAFLNGLLWGSFIVWAHRKMLKRLGRTRLL
jgi:hypothetical protein